MLEGIGSEQSLNPWRRIVLLKSNWVNEGMFTGNNCGGWSMVKFGKVGGEANCMLVVSDSFNWGFVNEGRRAVGSN